MKEFLVDAGKFCGWWFLLSMCTGLLWGATCAACQWAQRRFGKKDCGCPDYQRIRCGGTCDSEKEICLWHNAECKGPNCGAPLCRKCAKTDLCAECLVKLDRAMKVMA
jgi:hypothetical protein